MAEFCVIDGAMSNKPESPINVVFANYIDTVPTSWQELFRGYEELYALTYSLGLKQVEDVMDLFQYGEVIIGSPSQIRQLPAQMFAEQQYDIDFFSQHRSLQDRIRNGNFHFYVTTGSHAKIYLLKAYDGRRRVIMSSANFSVGAWDSSQTENFTCFDSPELYEQYFNFFEMLRHDCADEIGFDAKEIRDDGKNLDDLPLVKRIVQTQGAVVIHDVPDNTEEEYIIKTTAETKKWAKRLEEAGITASKENILTINPKSVTKMKQYMHEEHNKRTSKLVMNPELLVDFRQKSASFADKELDLAPSSEETQRDIDLLLQYLQGTNGFTGDTAELRTIYWKIIIFMFCTPFIASLRYCYREIAPANSVGRPFPMYMLIRGPKNGGKSSIIKTIQHLMCGKALAKLPPSVISPKSFEEYLLQVKGCPILIDDVNNSRLKYLKDIVKNEDVLLRAGVQNHGCFILTTNEAEKIDADVAKRVIIFNIRNQLTDDEATKKDRSLHHLQKQMGTALYRKYLSLMLPRVENLLEEIRNDSFENPDWIPDIFALSSRTLLDVFTESGTTPPSELQPYGWHDFMGEAIKADKAVNIIRQAYAIAPDIFTIKHDKDLLLMDLTKANLTPKDIESLKNELPVASTYTCVGSTLPIQLSSIAEYAGIDFDKNTGLVDKLINWFKGN